MPNNHLGMGRKERKGRKNIQICSCSLNTYFVPLLLGKMLSGLLDSLDRHALEIIRPILRGNRLELK